MKNRLTLLLLVIAIKGFAAIKPGFDHQEIKELIQLCNTYTYQELYGSDEKMIPNGYVKVYQSPAYGMDNKFQIYRHGDVGIINFRGSTDKKMSWLENLYSAMIPVEGTIQVNSVPFYYKVGEDTSGAVHGGYVLAINFFQEDLLDQMRKLNHQGVYEWIITGHSQGGAIAQMTRCYLEYLPNTKVSRKNQYKVYAFANPMIGDKDFVNEYNAKFCKNQMSFLIHNPEDLVPTMPMSYNDSATFRTNLQSLIFDRDNFNFKETLTDAMYRTMDGKLNKINQYLARNLNKEIGRELGEIVMPRFIDGVNYMHTGNRMLISSTEYPLELKDSSILENDSLMAIYTRDDNGVFENKGLYKKQKWTLQHKPYNYYTAILKDFFPKEYAALDEKYFVLPNEE